MASEKTALSQSMDSVQQGYGLDSHCKFQKSPCPTDSGKDLLVDYEPLKLSTFRVFSTFKLTVLTDPLLHIEQILITCIFVCFAVPTAIFFNQHLAEDRKGDISVRRWVSSQEDKMRAFAMIMTSLAAFLLSFYTATAVARWWTMRTAGVGGIKAATVELEWLLYQNVTQDKTILGAIRRYGRASLMLIFLWRQEVPPEQFKDELVKRGLLDEEEAEKLVSFKNGAKHETIWAWQGGIITTLKNEGKIKSDPLFNTLIQKCTDGRAAVQCAHTHLAVKVPMQYVHVLGFLVKMHNFVLAMIMGMLFGMAYRNGETIICAQTFGRTLILPFLFNAILLINANLADPFGGDATDFPGAVYSSALDKDCVGFMDATDKMPNWLKERFDKSKPGQV